MAAGDPITLTKTTITALNTDTALTLNAADADTNDLAQKFYYTPAAKEHKVALGFQVANSHGAVSFAITKGARVFGTAANKTFTTAQATTDIIQIETGKYMLADGTIEITATPASGKKLTTDHALKIFVIELL